MSGQFDDDMMPRGCGGDERLGAAWEEPFSHEGITYLCLEAAYQAQKVSEKESRGMFSLLSASEAVELGRRVFPLPRGWHNRRRETMLSVMRSRFAPGTMAGTRFDVLMRELTPDTGNWDDMMPLLDEVWKAMYPDSSGLGSDGTDAGALLEKARNPKLYPPDGYRCPLTIHTAAIDMLKEDETRFPGPVAVMSSRALKNKEVGVPLFTMLSPDSQLFRQLSSKDLDPQMFADLYWRGVLSKLDRDSVIQKLGRFATGEGHVTLVGLWPAGRPCWRHVAASWLDGKVRDWHVDM